MSLINRMSTAVAVAITAAMVMIGSTQASERQLASRALIERTGITVQMYSLSTLVAESSETHADRCGLQSAGDTVPGFDADSIIFDTLTTFNKNHPQSIKPIERWYESSLAKKIQAAEKESIDSAAYSEFLQSPVYKDSTRQKLLHTIVDHLQIPRFVAVIGSEIEYAGIVHSGCIESSEEAGKTNREQLLADITRDDKSLTATLMRGEIIAETAYLYRDLDDAELAAYAEFTSSEIGQTFYSHLIDAMQESLTLAGNRLTHSLRPEVIGWFDF